MGGCEECGGHRRCRTDHDQAIGLFREHVARLRGRSMELETALRNLVRKVRKNEDCTKQLGWAEEVLGPAVQTRLKVRVRPDPGITVCDIVADIVSAIGYTARFEPDGEVVLCRRT